MEQPWDSIEIFLDARFNSRSRSRSRDEFEGTGVRIRTIEFTF